VVALLALFAYLATRKVSFIPNRLQNAAEMIVGAIDDMVCGILGPDGRKYTPFIGTLFLYILGMNLLGLIPFMKSPTSDWSITLGLSICVFVYVQYTAIRTMGFLGYADHLAGKPRGVLAFTVILPLTTFIVHLLSEFIKPISLSLRLRSNIWGEDIMLAVLAGFGLKGLPLLFLNTLMALLTAVVQALVFTLLSTIYFALVLTKEE
ncbi:MAG: F0F1 ATP synthase subunit A, partial [Candidatus Omnitrophota bacterium]|nr:F0F1 ATP synthase subunit A [Candidatus Omnitrophota bacterium]